MTSLEFSAWSCLVTTLLVWGSYFLWVAGAPHEGAVLSVVLAAAIGVHALLTGVARGRARRERSALADERDIAIGLRACSTAYWVLLVAVGLLLFTPVALLDRLGGCGPLLLASLVGAELLRFGTQVVAYRAAAER